MRSMFSFLWLGLALVAPAAAVANERSPLRHEERLDSAAAEWISLGRRVAAFGAGDHLVVADTEPRFRILQRYTLPFEIVEGVIAGTRLYVVQEHDGDQRLAVLDLESPAVAPRPIALRPEPRAALHVAVMDDYLVVAEDGHGVRVLALPSHGHDHAQHHPATGPEQIGFLPLAEPVHALTAVRRTIVVSTAGDLWFVNASIPAAPVVSTRLPVGVVAHSMAGNGSDVLLLHAGGVSRMDIESGVVDPVDSKETGSGIYQAGRDIYLATDEGLHHLRDVSPQAATFVVQVGDVFFNPAGTINVNVGDTVQWQKPNTVFSHNVFSCNAAQSGCGGIASTEVFVSGLPTTAGFNFQHTFQAAGSNPYLCQVHALTMRGDINVTGGAASPPGVADGSGLSTPMTVDRAVPAGADLTIAFDTSCPDATDHNILVGTSADLPAGPGGTYTPATARCDIGTSSPFVWAASPMPPSGDFVWWVLAADDGSGTEGAWGKDSAGVERNGAGAGGASGLCGITNKDITNTCGQ